MKETYGACAVSVRKANKESIQKQEINPTTSTSSSFTHEWETVNGKQSDTEIVQQTFSGDTEMYF